MTEWRTDKPSSVDFGREVVAVFEEQFGSRKWVTGKLTSWKMPTSVETTWAIVRSDGKTYNLSEAQEWRFTAEGDSNKSSIELQWGEYCSLWDQFENPGTKTQLSFWREMSATKRAAIISRMKDALGICNASHFQREYESTHGEVW